MSNSGADAGADAAPAGAAAPRRMRMPSSPMLISTSPLGALAPGAAGSTFTTGFFFSGTTSQVCHFRLNGGMFCRMPVEISSSSESSRNRFQLMPTSQLP